MEVWNLKNQLKMGTTCQGLIEQTISYTPPTSGSEPNSKLDSVATVCNSLPDPLLVYRWSNRIDAQGNYYYFQTADNGTLISPGACFFWRDVDDILLLLYRFTGGNSYTAAAWVEAYNPIFGYPYVRVGELMGPEDSCAPKFTVTDKFDVGETLPAYSYGHFQMEITRNPDSYGAKQLLVNVEILEGQISVTKECTTFEMIKSFP